MSAVTPRSSIACMHRSQRTGLLTCMHQPGEVLASALHDRAVGVGQEAGAGIVGGDRAGEAAQVLDGRCHVLGVEGPGHRQGAQSSAFWRVVLEGGELVHRSGGDDLAGPVDVGRGEAVLLDGGKDGVGVTAEHRGHAGLGDRSSCRHGLAALADEDHRLLGRHDTGRRRRSDLADRVSGTDADLAESVSGVGEEAEQRHQAGRHDQRLGDRGIANRLGVGLGAVVHEVEVGARRRAIAVGLRIRAVRATGRGSREPGRPDRARR